MGNIEGVRTLLDMDLASFDDKDAVRQTLRFFLFLSIAITILHAILSHFNFIFQGRLHHAGLRNGWNETLARFRESQKHGCVSSKRSWFGCGCPSISRGC
jgi:hypothetical protein